MFRIGEFSKMSKTTVKTLHYYDEVGLLKPEEIDRFTGYRYYSTNQLIRLHQIQSFRQVGLSIDEIKLVLSWRDPTAILQKRKAELISELAKGASQLSQIDFILRGKGEDCLMDYTATIKELPACTVYSKRITLPDYDAYFDLVPAIGKSIEKQYPNLKCAVPEYCFTVFLDGEYKEKDINIEFCEAVDKAWPDFDDIVFKEIKSTPAITVLHKGPYAKLSRAYTYAFKWLEENGFTAADNPRESYIDGIWNKKSEEDWLTELQIPIVEK